jgi:hypothetical protein
MRLPTQPRVMSYECVKHNDSDRSLHATVGPMAKPAEHDRLRDVRDLLGQRRTIPDMIRIWIKYQPSKCYRNATGEISTTTYRDDATLSFRIRDPDKPAPWNLGAANGRLTSCNIFPFEHSPRIQRYNAWSAHDFHTGAPQQNERANSNQMFWSADTVLTPLQDTTHTPANERIHA